MTDPWDDPRMARAVAAASRALGEPARWLGGWLDVPLVPALAPPLCAVRLVYALPAARIASLRPWTDVLETTTDGAPPLHIVAMEASTWARLVLRRHEPTHWLLFQPPLEDRPQSLAGLTALACPDTARVAIAELGWQGAAVERTGSAWNHPERGTSPIDRRDALDAWLREARSDTASPCVLDASPRPTTQPPPGPGTSV